MSDITEATRTIYDLNIKRLLVNKKLIKCPICYENIANDITTLKHHLDIHPYRDIVTEYSVLWTIVWNERMIPRL